MAVLRASPRVAILVFLVFAAAGAISERASGSGASASGDATVEMMDFHYAPRAVSVPAGAQVTWTNTSTAPHTATSPFAVFDSTVKKPGESWSFVFEKPGTFPYECIFHEGMRGEVVVLASDASPGAPPPPAPASQEVAQPGASSGRGGVVWLGALGIALGAASIGFAVAGGWVVRREARR